MSTHWGYYCRTCNVSSPHWLNHGENLLVHLLRDREIVTKAAALFQQHDIEIKHSGVFYDPSPWQFLVDHEDHILLLENEYGERQLASRFKG